MYFITDTYLDLFHCHYVIQRNVSETTVPLFTFPTVVLCCVVTVERGQINISDTTCVKLL